jgi:flagella basal body P-ring formation protein FlgA
MSHKAAIAAIVICLVTSIQCSQASADSKADDPRDGIALQIHLPREVTIRDDELKLGQVAVVHGDESLVAIASSISLGRISLPGQKVVVDRSTILSRLACSGISTDKVILTGAQAITVEQQRQVIKGTELVEIAKSLLKKHPAASSAHQWEAVRIPRDLILPGPSRDVRLSPQLAKNGSTNQARVRITVLANGNELATREVNLYLKYNCRRAVTLVEIPTGTVISPQNVEIEQALSDRPEPADWRPPYGLIARRRLPAHATVSPDMITAAKSPVVVKRNETVVIQVELPGIMVTAMGKTMQEGHVGEHIKVRNCDSQRIILCRVGEDGTVEPVL